MWPNNVTKADLRIEFYKGSGKGGQHRNKRDTACRITHIPTGKSSCSEEHKSQPQNKREAFNKLAKILVPLMVPKIKVEKSTVRVRTYNAFRGTVKDDRIPDEIFNYKEVLDGDLDPIIERLKNE